MRHLVLHLLLVLYCAGSAFGAEHELEYSPPDIVDCDHPGSLGLALSSNSCIVVYSYVRVDVGFDSSAGFVSDHEAHLRLGVVRETDVGPLLAVATLTSARDFFWGEYVPPDIDVDVGGGGIGFEPGNGSSDWGYTSGVPRLDEFYMGLGDAVRLQVGKVETVLNLDDDEPLDSVQLLLGGGTDWSFEVQPWLLASEKGYSPSVQLITDLGNGAVLKLAAEDVDHGGALLGVLEYDQGNVRSHLSVAHFSETEVGPVWSAHFGSETSAGPMTLVAAGAYDTTGYWSALTSASLDLAIVELAATLEQRSTSDRAVGLSAEVDLGDYLSVSIGGRAMTDEAGLETQLVALGAELEMFEGVELSAERGRIVDSWDTTSYWMGRLDWDAGNGFEAVVKATAVDTGGYKVETGFQQVLQ